MREWTIYNSPKNTVREARLHQKKRRQIFADKRWEYLNREGEWLLPNSPIEKSTFQHNSAVTWCSGSALFFIKQIKPSGVDFCYTLYEYICIRSSACTVAKLFNNNCLISTWNYIIDQSPFNLPLSTAHNKPCLPLFIWYTVTQGSHVLNG